MPLSVDLGRTTGKEKLPRQGGSAVAEYSKARGFGVDSASEKIPLTQRYRILCPPNQARKA